MFCLHVKYALSPGDNPIAVNYYYYYHHHHHRVPEGLGVFPVP